MATTTPITITIATAVPATTAALQRAARFRRAERSDRARAAPSAASEWGGLDMWGVTNRSEERRSAEGTQGPMFAHSAKASVKTPAAALHTEFIQARKVQTAFLLASRPPSTV